MTTMTTRLAIDPDTRARTSSPELVSIVVPTLDEAAQLPDCLAALAAQAPPVEIIVADGGSGDGTPELARTCGARTGIRTIDAPRGRASQLTAGARAARGEVLLFVHADTRLAPDAVERIRRAVAAGSGAGAFTMRFDRAALDYRLAAWLGDLYCRLTGDLFGDRAMFVTRAAFDAVGGFRALDLMEDLDLAVRLRRAGHRAVLLPGPVVTSARRAESMGVWRFAWRCIVLIRAFHRGAPLDERLAGGFRDGKLGGGRP